MATKIPTYLIKTNTQVDAKKKLIEPYFEHFCDKNKKLEEIYSKGYTSEAVTLACCYIEALGNIRYQRSENKRNFIDIIFDYSEKGDQFSKICYKNFIKYGKDDSEKYKPGIPIANYHKLKDAFQKKLIGCNHKEDMGERVLIEYLKGENLKLDYGSLKKNFCKFSYASILYERYRNAGVHIGDILVPRDVETGERLFEKNENGEDIYCEDGNLRFSKEIIFLILERIIRNLKKECLEKGKWPGEL